MLPEGSTHVSKFPRQIVAKPLALRKRSVERHKYGKLAANYRLKLTHQLGVLFTLEPAAIFAPTVTILSLLRCVPVYLLSLLSPNAVEPQPPQVLPFDVPGTVNEMIRLRDGSLLVGGMFRRFNGQPMTNLVKVLPQGSIDPQFDSAVTWTVETIAEGPDRKLYLGRNDQSSLISRLSPQGSPDDFHLSYVPQFNGFASPPANLAVAGDGTIYVSGNLSTLSLDGATYVAARPEKWERIGKVRVFRGGSPSSPRTTGAFLESGLLLT